MLAKRRLPRLEKVDVGRSLHEADVRHGMDESARLSRHAARDRMRPELLRVLELLEDRQRPADLHAAIRLAGGCVADLA